LETDGGRKLIYGTDSGIFVSDRRANYASVKPRRVLDATNVTQIDVLDQYQLLLVLSNKSLLSWPLSALDPNEPVMSKRSKKIQSHCNFFKTGVCLGRMLVCCVKSSALSTTIKVFEPNDAMSKGKKQKGFGLFSSTGQDELKAFKEFYIPTESSSIHFLKSKLCVACARGFEVVSLETLETQSLLDIADTSLDFVARKENVRPIHIERLNGEFLLNYSEFSFFVNRNGWRARPDWRIDWEGLPQNFALSYPWILAFEPNFIEIRNIETNAVHIIPAKNIRMLHTSTREVSSLSRVRVLGMHANETDHICLRRRQRRRHCRSHRFLARRPKSGSAARTSGGPADSEWRAQSPPNAASAFPGATMSVSRCFSSVYITCSFSLILECGCACIIYKSSRATLLGIQGGGW
jgi:hypothetical protein